jgi:hypothetical protein
MKLKNKIYTLLSVFTLVGLTHSFTLKDLNASLTAPASYDYSYTYDGLFSYELNVLPTLVFYERTADGIYYNYSSTFELINGLEITQTFNRSNTSWTFISGDGYIPTDTKIGSDNTIGTITRKWSMKYDNQTSKDYLLYLDHSSSPAGNVSLRFIHNSTSVYTYQSDAVLSFPTEFIKVIIPSFSSLEIFTNSTLNTRYFDAWYLKDLGVSASYDAGVDAGELIGYDDGYADGLGNNPNVLLNGFQAMVGILVNFMLMIVNLEVFGVSLINVFSILALFVGIVWILKIIRG